MTKRKFLFCSDIALYPPLLRVAEIITHDYDLEGHVIMPEEFIESPVYQIPGKSEKKNIDPNVTPLTLHFLPGRNANVVQYGFEATLLRRVLDKIKPDYIWLFAEFFQGITSQFLWHYRFRRCPRIIAYAAGNHIKKGSHLFSSRPPFLSRTRFKQILLWPRLDGVAACATKAMECARRLGLPEKVPVLVNYLPVFGPDDAAEEGISLPWSRDDSFIIGFAGLLSEQKGWKVLLEAVERLPHRFKVVLAGDGEQKGELEAWLKRPTLHGRAFYAGLLPKRQLLATYPLLDVLVLPSITTSYSVEQFGAVLAEAMACGVPVIGSDSGAIPEAIDRCGLIFPEGDADALAQAILLMCADENLRRKFVKQGQERYATYYSCQAYAESIATLLNIQ